jgi:hypothetical protein
MQMFGPAAQFVAESESPDTALVFAHSVGDLQRSARPIPGATG